jgi:hypothetical protein
MIDQQLGTVVIGGSQAVLTISSSQVIRDVMTDRVPIVLCARPVRSGDGH